MQTCREWQNRIEHIIPVWSVLSKEMGVSDDCHGYRSLLPYLQLNLYPIRSLIDLFSQHLKLAILYGFTTIILLGYLCWTLSIHLSIPLVPGVLLSNQIKNVTQNGQILFYYDAMYSYKFENKEYNGTTIVRGQDVYLHDDSSDSILLNIQAFLHGRRNISVFLPSTKDPFLADIVPTTPYVCLSTLVIFMTIVFLFKLRPWKLPQVSKMHKLRLDTSPKYLFHYKKWLLPITKNAYNYEDLNHFQLDRSGKMYKRLWFLHILYTILCFCLVIHYLTKFAYSLELVKSNSKMLLIIYSLATSVFSFFGVLMSTYVNMEVFRNIPIWNKPLLFTENGSKLTIGSTIDCILILQRAQYSRYMNKPIEVENITFSFNPFCSCRACSYGVPGCYSQAGPFSCYAMENCVQCAPGMGFRTLFHIQIPDNIPPTLNGQEFDLEWMLDVHVNFSVANCPFTYTETYPVQFILNHV